MKKIKNHDIYHKQCAVIEFEHGTKKELDELDEKEIIDVLEYDPSLYCFYKNKKQEHCIKYAFEYYPLFDYIENPSEELCLKFIKEDPENIQYIENPSEKICEIAIKEKPSLLWAIKNPSNYICELAVKLNSDNVRHVPKDKLTLKMCIDAIRKDKYISVNISEDLLNKLLDAAAKNIE